MHLDFEEVKKIPIPQVCAKFGIRLRYRGEYANAPCPLPTHPRDDKNNKAFSIHVPSNTWRCFHTGCSASHGCGDKAGDVINFVQTKESLRGPKEAAELIAKWYGINGNKNGHHSGGRSSDQARKPAHKDFVNPTTSNGDGKGFVRELGNWFDELIVQAEHEDDAVFWDRVKKGVINVALLSFRNGKKAATGLPVEPLSVVYLLAVAGAIAPFRALDDLCRWSSSIGACVLRMREALFLAFSQFGTANEFNKYVKLDLEVAPQTRIERNASYESR